MRIAGAVVIQGAKATGKTETGKHHAASVAFLDTDVAARTLASDHPELLLDAELPLLVDEWQLEPEIWNHIRRAIDEHQTRGGYILTGSATPRADSRRHSGAGRFSFLKMRPMSLFESGDSSGEISLADLFSGSEPTATKALHGIVDIGELLVRGGWPGRIDDAAADALILHTDYLDQISEVDVPDVAEGFRDPLKIKRLLSSIGRNVATEVGVAELARDSGGVDGRLDDATINRYLDALERLMVLENQPAWSVHLRSRAKLRLAPKRHFVDPSLAIAAVGGSVDRLVRDTEAFGQLFESLVVRDLRVLSDPLGGEVMHYRDSYGVEADAIIQLRDGRWAACEVKLSDARIDEGAESLLRFADAVDTGQAGSPAFLAVVVATGPGYVRPDGVRVVPIGALGP